MKVFIDVDSLQNYPHNGVSVYTVNLLTMLSREKDINLYSDLSTFKTKVFNSTLRVIEQNALKVNISQNKISERIVSRLPFFIRKYMYRNIFACDFAHYTCHLPNDYLRELKYIVTFHDIAGIKHPNCGYWSPKTIYSKSRYQKVLDNAASIISVSNFTKKEIMEVFNIPENKIFVTHQGTQWNISDLQNQQPISSNFQYFLAVGTLNPRKNYINLITAFLEFRKKHKNIKLVIIGSKGWMYKEVENLILSNKHSIKWFSKISQNELFRYYSGALSLIQNSFYEGFGIPTLEAMESGCPVIVSKNSAMSEISDGCSVEVEPDSIEDLVGAMEKMLEASFRDSLIRRGKIKSKEFTWNTTAAKTINVYKHTFQ